MQQTSSSKPLWNKLSSSRLTRFMVFIVLLLICLAILFGIQTTFKVKTISLDKKNSGPDLLGIDSIKDVNTLFISEKNITDELYEANPNVKIITVEKKLPDNIIIHVEYATPLAYIKVDTGYLLLSEEGRILEKSKQEPQGVALIRYYQLLHYNSYSSGDTINFIDISRTLQFLKKAKEIGVSINSVDITGFDMIALNTTSQKILFTLEKKQSDQEYQFERVIHQLKVEGKQFKTLDFRFDKVIVGS